MINSIGDSEELKLMFCRTILHFHLLEHGCHKMKYLCNKNYLTILEDVIKSLKQHGINRTNFEDKLSFLIASYLIC
ncbi:unnamed protein product [Candidatus Protochlamydia amoebophila UWE25]|uniref:Uncharacterized protein n=1 Tax=Protochlamydia amoebophila (strain UWE25) TaxID=264201 RepID=Q6M9Q6_PARUW|nr:unnamed protein product [Candidatus Protochlamydia amoebophila UWE25]